MVDFPNEGADGYVEGGYHHVSVGDIFNDTYVIVRKLGFGVYSTVWLANDRKNDRAVALKILRSGAGDRELGIMQRISNSDASHPGRNHVVQLLDYFVHVGPNGTHLCLVMDIMAQNVARFSHLYPRSQIPAHLVKRITKQVLLALDYLHDICGLIHADIHDQNILVGFETPGTTVAEVLAAENGEENHRATDIEPRASEGITLLPSIPFSPYAQSDDVNYDRFTVKLADFGSANFADDIEYDHVGTGPLKPPETVLQLSSWDSAVDIWMFGLTVYEMLTGSALLEHRPPLESGLSSNAYLFQQIVDLFGPIPNKMLELVDLREFLISEGRPLGNPYSQCIERQLFLSRIYNSGRDQAEIGDFVRQMMQIDPGERASARDMLKHRWLQTDLELEQIAE